ncbi:MAG: HK97 gp10 family phage protein [Ruminiclostridium sp.]|nr:HK97 gp10 family phage protein [Ruminiclostridium sp.]
MGVKIPGLQAMVKKLNDLGANVEKTADESLRKSADMMKREVENNISRVSVSYKGRIYKAVDTGRLKNNIHVNKLGSCRYAVGTDVKYATYVEFGIGSAGDPVVAHNISDKCMRKNKQTGESKLVHFAPQPPRPYMRPAFNSLRDVVIQNMSNAITKAWKEGAG